MSISITQVIHQFFLLTVMINVFLVNAIIYVITLLYFINKYREFNYFVLIWLLYTIIAVSGYLCVDAGYYYAKDRDLGYKASFIPYIFIYITVWLLSYPFKKVKPKKVDLRQIVSSWSLSILIYCSLPLFLILTIMRVYETIIATTIGLGEAYKIGNADHERLVEYSNNTLSAISVWGAVYCEIIFPIVVMFFIARIIMCKGFKTFNILGVILGFLPSVLTPLSGGSKGGLFFSFFSMIFFYIYFKDRISKRLKQNVTIVGLIILLLFVIGAYSIDESRNEVFGKSDTTATEVLLTYMGEPMPNVTYFFYEKIKKHPFGRRFYPEIFGNTLDNKFRSVAADQQYWTKQTGAEVRMFKTLWGDCYIEFSFLGIIYIMFIIFLWDKIVFRRCNNVIMLPLVYYYYNYFIMWGLFVHSFTGYYKHIYFLYLIIVCLFVNFLIKKKPQTKNT